MNKDINNGSKQFIETLKPKITVAALREDSDFRESLSSRLANIDYSENFNKDFENNGNVIYSIIIDGKVSQIKELSNKLPVDVFLAIKSETRWSLARPQFVTDLREGADRKITALSNVDSVGCLTDKLNSKLEEWKLDWRVK